ncbi:unnamed protein product [Paramecium sonneborni]|uniref:Uncharacterized protein n=1 Tax=Paramecium sonneborni TaxID=65129 RepID=A0A8S1PDC7_9CILI|nr:unnamed protein product [Paramecium sonneborni]
MIINIKINHKFDDQYLQNDYERSGIQHLFRKIFKQYQLWSQEIEYLQVCASYISIVLKTLVAWEIKIKQILAHANYKKQYFDRLIAHSVNK